MEAILLFSENQSHSMMPPLPFFTDDAVYLGYWASHWFLQTFIHLYSCDLVNICPTWLCQLLNVNIILFSNDVLMMFFLSFCPQGNHPACKCDGCWRSDMFGNRQKVGWQSELTKGSVFLIQCLCFYVNSIQINKKYSLHACVSGPSEMLSKVRDPTALQSFSTAMKQKSSAEQCSANSFYIHGNTRNAVSSVFSSSGQRRILLPWHLPP